MSKQVMGPVQIARYVHDETAEVEYRIRWTAEIDAVAAHAAARMKVDTPTPIARAVYAAVSSHAGVATGETEH